MALPAYGPCRSIGHSWRRTWTVEREARGSDAVTLVLRCAGCPTERRDLYAKASGALIRRRYDYPKDYLWHRVEPEDVRPDKQSYRVEWLGELLKGGARIVNIGNARATKRRRSA